MSTLIDLYLSEIFVWDLTTVIHLAEIYNFDPHPPLYRLTFRVLRFERLRLVYAMYIVYIKVFQC
jgi:hypothetical protein